MDLLSESRNAVAESVYSLFADELLLDRAQIVPNLMYNSIPEWDSVAHINIILSLEEAFSVSFDDAEIGELTSLKKIIATIERRTSQSN